MITVSAAELDAWLAGFLYPFFRILALLAAAPMFAHRSVPRRVRIGLALLLTLLVAPALPAYAPVSPFSAEGVLLVVQQVLVGGALGLAVHVAFAAVGLAGDMVGLQMGLSFAAFVDPVNAEQSPIIGSFLTMTLMLVFLAINGHLLIVAALVDSFTTVPPTITGVRWVDAWRIAETGASLFAQGLTVALPVIGAMLLTNLAFGILTRTAPQLNLFAVGFPVTLIVGLLVLLLGLRHQVPVFENVISRSVELFAR
jgi:flagellar biosynthetic protein FliR